MENFLKLIPTSYYFKNYIVEIILFFTASFLMTKVLYSYIIHLKKLPPGPWGLPIVGYLPFLGNEPHKTLAALKEKYGDIIGIKLGWKYVVVLNEYSVFKEALNNPITFNRPERIFGTVKLGLSSISGQEWKEQRNFVLHIMRNLGLGRKPWEKLSQESADYFNKILRKYKGKPVNVTGDLQEILVSLIMAFIYGKLLQPETDKDKIKKSLDFSQLGIRHYGPSAPATLIPGFDRFCEFFNIGRFRESANAIKTFLNMANKEIENHWIEENYQEYKDYANMYKAKLIEMKEHEGKHFFNEENMVGNGNSLFLGSSDITTSSLRTLFRMMANNPNVQRKVQEELDDVIGKDGLISYDGRSKIPYTFATLLEAQRFVSVVPLSTTRQLSEDMEVRGYLLPKGSWMTGNIYALHNDLNYWENPHVFQPERFLTDDMKELNTTPKSYLPFSSGKRNCPAETLSWVVILSVFSKVMQNYSIRLPPGDKIILETEGNIVSHLKPQPLCFIERL